MTASLLILSAVSATVVAPSPASAAEAITVWVHPTHFQGPDPAAPSRIYAEPNQEIIFKLADPADRHHTVTVIPAHCEGKPRSLCDKAFDDPFGKYPDPSNPTVTFRWSREGEYRFYDRYAWEEARREMTGIFIVTHAPQPVQPSPTTPTSTTVTTAPTTTVTTAPTTTTTAPTAIRPQFVPEPPSTTTTTAAPAPPTTAKNGGPPAPAPAPKKVTKGKDKAKSKLESPASTTTTVPAPPDTAWIDSLLDPSSLTPSPTGVPDQPAGSEDEVAIDAARAASLLDRPASESDDNTVLLLVLAAVAGVLLSGGFWAWFTRASRYDPA
jgi:hypothetical protein